MVLVKFRCSQRRGSGISDSENVTHARLAPDYSFVTTAGGERISFTRSERLALAALASNPNRLLTRDQILDALAGQGSDRSDRNIDFLVNRLRRKLSDDVRNPRFIATRYGEGYVWIGRPTSVDPDYAGAYLVVGPLRGLDNLGGDRGLAEIFASDLQAALRSELPAERRVVLAPDCPPSTDFAPDMPALSIEMTFFQEGEAVNSVAAAREFRSGRILAIHRIAIPADDRAAAMRSATGLAGRLLDQAWRTLATQTEADAPLPVLMNLASTSLDDEHGALADSNRHLQSIEARFETRAMARWREDERRLMRLRQASPDDAVLKLMYATHIHSKYIQLGHYLFQAEIDERHQDEIEIEQLVLGALAQVQSQPEYAIIAAKLLHFLDRGYFELAQDLAEQAYRASTAAAGSLAIIGQLRAFAGETEAALRCIDQALTLVTPGSKPHLYALTIKMQALLAVADFERLNEAKRELYSLSAATMLFYEPIFANPDKLSLRAKAVMMMLPRDKVAAQLKLTNYVAARLFRVPEHRANSILTALTLFVRRFGKAAIPEEIAAAYPGLSDRFP